MLIFKLATRNLFRQFSRNALSMLSIIVGVMIIGVGRGFQNGLNENMVRGQIDSSSGHVVAVPTDYPTAGFRQPVSDAFALTDENRAWLDEHTRAWAPRLIATPRAIAGRDSMQVRMISLSDRDDSVFPKDDYQIEGDWPRAGQVLVASKPAKLLELKPGSVLTLETRTVDGAMNAMRYPVSGVVRTGQPMIDNITVFLPQADADSLLVANGRVTHVATLLDRRNQSEAFAPQLDAQLDGAESRTWQSEVGPLIEATAMRQTMFDVMGLAMLMMAAAGIANTVLMAAYERTREIGTLRSMGLGRGGVLGMFAMEGFWMGLVGGVVGALIAGAITGWFSTNGIDLASMMAGKEDQMGNVPMATKLYLEFSPTTLVVSVVVGIAVAILASIYPAIAASRISPAEAVRAS